MSWTKINQNSLKLKAITTTGTAPNLEVSIPRENYTSLVDQKLFLKVHATCNGAVTINVEGGGAKALKDSWWTVVDSLTAGDYIECSYNWTDFVMGKVKDENAYKKIEIISFVQSASSNADVVYSHNLWKIPKHLDITMTWWANAISVWYSDIISNNACSYCTWNWSDPSNNSSAHCAYYKNWWEFTWYVLSATSNDITIRRVANTVSGSNVYWTMKLYT